MKYYIIAGAHRLIVMFAETRARLANEETSMAIKIRRHGYRATAGAVDENDQWGVGTKGPAGALVPTAIGVNAAATRSADCKYYRVASGHRRSRRPSAFPGGYPGCVCLKKLPRGNVRMKLVSCRGQGSSVSTLGQFWPSRFRPQ